MAQLKYVSLCTVLALAATSALAPAVRAQEQTLTASDEAASDFFGMPIAISGNTLVVSVPGDDVTVANQGSVHVFVRTGGVWIDQQTLTASDRSVPAFPFDTFGRSVVLSGDTLVVGTPRNGLGAPTPPGAAYVFQRLDGVWSERQKLTAAGEDGQTNRFGNGLVLTGETLVVGAPGTNNDRGAVYVFVLGTAGVWTEQQKVTASDGLTGDSFGLVVALRGGSLLVGAAGDDVGPNNNQGSAYVFNLTNGVWTEQQKLIASDGAAGDRLGFSVEIRGNGLLVGTHLDMVAGNMFQGSVRVFSPSP